MHIFGYAISLRSCKMNLYLNLVNCPYVFDTPAMPSREIPPIRWCFLRQFCHPDLAVRNLRVTEPASMDLAVCSCCQHRRRCCFRSCSLRPTIDWDSKLWDPSPQIRSCIDSPFPGLVPTCLGFSAGSARADSCKSWCIVRFCDLGSDIGPL